MPNTNRFAIRNATVVLLVGIAACAAPIRNGAAAPTDPAARTEPERQIVGEIERYDARADAVIPPGAVIERLTDDLFGWAEGPVWMAERGQLLFTDVPGNTLYGWTEEGGLDVILKPSGVAAPVPEGLNEGGANGLVADGPDAVLMGDHGSRAVMRLDLDTMEKTVLADRFEGQRFSSPNDLVRAASGDVYFTDPPYGLDGGDESPRKEIPFNGVYRLSPDGSVAVVDDSLVRPNGVALSPDEATLYVAQSSPDAATFYAYDLGQDGMPTARRVLIDLTDMIVAGEEGLPDGLAVMGNGQIFLTGPGGVHLLSPDGERLALIRTGSRVANVTLTDEEDALYLTSHRFLARVQLAR